jgi:hypothetical protein
MNPCRQTQGIEAFTSILAPPAASNIGAHRAIQAWNHAFHAAGRRGPGGPRAPTCAPRVVSYPPPPPPPQPGSRGFYQLRTQRRWGGGL